MPIVRLTNGATSHVSACDYPFVRRFRWSPSRQNLYNRGTPITSTSGVKGVRWHTQGKWHVRIHCKGREHHIGLFTDLTEAKKAYNKAARRLHGKFAFQHRI